MLLLLQQIGCSDCWGWINISHWDKVCIHLWPGCKVQLAPVHSRSILWFLLHSLLNHEKWITCIFSVKNDSMTHKTINLSDMCYFQPPILIKITVNPLFQFLMLPDNQTRHGKFTFFKVKLYKKGKNMFPSQAYRPSRPIWIVKTWFKPIFSFNTTILSLSRKNVLLISI